MKRRIGVTGLIVAVALGSTLGVARAEVATVALKKDNSPEDGFWYRRFNRPAVSDAVEEPVSFFATIRGLTSSKKGLFKDGPGRDDTGSTIVLINDLGPAGRVFKQLSAPAMNSAGDVAFSATLTGGMKGVFRGDRSVVALLGDQVPGVTGALDEFAHAVVTDGEGVVFRATISGAGEVGGVKVDEGIFRCDGGDGNCSSGTGSLEALVLKGDSVDDRPDREFCNINEVTASSFGIAFVGETKEDCTDVNEFPQAGTFRRPFGGSVVTVALEGEPCEPFDEPLGTSYGLIWTLPHIANDGSVVFKARMSGVLSDTALYLCLIGSCPAAPAQAAVIQGTLDPDGNTFKRFGLPAVKSGGDLAFKATGRGPSGTVTGVYVRRSGGALETVALEGDIVPDLEPFTAFARILAKTSRLDMSPGGRIAFKANVMRLSPPRVRLEGIFLADVRASPSGAFLEFGGDVF